MCTVDQAQQGVWRTGVSISKVLAVLLRHMQHCLKDNVLAVCRLTQCCIYETSKRSTTCVADDERSEPLSEYELHISPFSRKGRRSDSFMSVVVFYAVYAGYELLLKKEEKDTQMVSVYEPALLCVNLSSGFGTFPKDMRRPHSDRRAYFDSV